MCGYYTRVCCGKATDHDPSCGDTTAAKAPHLLLVGSRSLACWSAAEASALACSRAGRRTGSTTDGKVLMSSIRCVSADHGVCRPMLHNTTTPLAIVSRISRTTSRAPPKLPPCAPPCAPPCPPPAGTAPKRPPLVRPPLGTLVAAPLGTLVAARISPLLLAAPGPPPNGTTSASLYDDDGGSAVPSVPSVAS
eukprot:5509291-Prymnesium_polylepis.3